MGSAPCLPATPPDNFLNDPRLNDGFRAMYSSDFEGAEKIFAGYARAYPESPLGYATESSALLFRELDRLRLLEAEFYVDEDEKVITRAVGAPDPKAKMRIFDLATRAEQFAKARLSDNPQDETALYSMMLTKGIQADYNALVERHYWTALRFGGQGESYARRLLTVDPQSYDAYLIIGVTEYVIGTLPAPVRWLVRLAGYTGSRKAGLRDLGWTAEKGQFLKSYAKILLVLVYLREKNRPAAVALVDDLHSEYPSNPLFAEQAKRLRERGK